MRENKVVHKDLLFKVGRHDRFQSYPNRLAGLAIECFSPFGSELGWEYIIK